MLKIKKRELKNTSQEVCENNGLIATVLSKNGWTTVREMTDEIVESILNRYMSSSRKSLAEAISKSGYFTIESRIESAIP